MINIDGVMFFRLSTGEDIVASVVFSDDKDFIVANPLKVVYLPKGQGLLSISFMQWVFSKITTNQEFLISNKDVLTISVPTDALIEHYFETVEYFNKTTTPHLNKGKIEEEELEEMFGDLEEELNSETAKDVLQFLEKIMSSNGKGTLH